MNREIKFRFWDSVNKNMYFESEDWACGLNEAFNVMVRRYDTIPLQYTGLKDKNGKEIYEGDIISYFTDGSKYFVEWHNEYAEYFLKSKHNGTDDVGFDQVNILDFEVIGNIYENPELCTPTTTE